MSLPPKKIEILEMLLMHNEPVRSKQLAEEMNNSFPEIQMHLIGLMKKGYAISPEKAYYAISEAGKEALGLPTIDTQKAKTILDGTPQSKSFHFYLELNKPLNAYAATLNEFEDEVTKVNVHSLEFHNKRGDFAVWFDNIGDSELTKKMELLQKMNIFGETLRSKLHEIVEMRRSYLVKLLAQ